MDHLAKIKNYYRLETSGILPEPIGSSADEISQLESHFDCELPSAYKQFLAWMGNDHQGVFVGCDWFLKDVRSNTEYLPDLLAENEVDWQLPEKHCGFMGHQGYIAAYFALPATGDDPDVYFFSEGRESNDVTDEGKFTEFLLRDMSGMIECVKQIHARRDRAR